MYGMADGYVTVETFRISILYHHSAIVYFHIALVSMICYLEVAFVPITHVNRNYEVTHEQFRRITTVCIM